jgi:hypothetical protein
MKILRRTLPQTASSSAQILGLTDQIARRRVQITVERETLVTSPPPSFEAYCTECKRQVVMVNPSSAALVAQVSIREIYRWVDARKLHFIEAPSGDIFLCAASLQASAPNDAPADDYPEPNTLPSEDPQ